jgi:hypothetical protein
VILLSAALFADCASAWEARAPESGKYRLVGGDMLMLDRGERDKRALIDRFSTRFWPSNTIPYTLTQANAATRIAFLAAIAEIHDKTQVRFVPRTQQRDYVRVESIAGNQCKAMTGYAGGAQLLQISASPQCASRSGLLHELVHTLGFVHEHNRPDRDQHIEILWKNVRQQSRKDLEIEPASLMQDAYDYDSVTHYAANVLSINGLSTLLPRKPGISSARLGNHSSLSPGDVRMINHAYPAERQLIARDSGQCLEARHKTRPTLRLLPCSLRRPAQFWRYRPDKGLLSNAAYPAYCLSQGLRHNRQALSQRCEDSARQRWLFQDGRLINLARGGSASRWVMGHTSAGDLLLHPLDLNHTQQQWDWGTITLSSVSDLPRP